MAKKNKKSLLPKRIAGVKIPKAVRKGRLGDAIASPTGRAVLAEVVMAAAAVAGAKKAKDAGVGQDALNEVTQRLRNAGDGAKGAGKAVASGAVTYAVGEAARAFVDALDRRRAEEQPKPADKVEGWSPEPPDVADSKKKPSSFEAVPH